MKDVPIKFKGQVFIVGLVDEARYFQQNVRGEHYAPVYDSRAFDYLAYRLIRRGKNKFDNRIVIAGPPRTGKTTIACTWAKKIDPDFPVENVTFRLDDFKKCLNELPAADPEHEKFPVAILDESGVDLYAKDWATTWVKAMAKVFQIVGKKRLTMIMNLPHRNLLAKDMRDAMHFWVNTSIEDEMRGYCEVREAKANPWTTPYWNPLFGVVFEEMSGKWWNEYEKRKDEFIDEYTSQESAPMNQRIHKLMEQRDLAIKALRKNHTLREIEDLTGVDDAQVSRIIDNRRASPSPHAFTPQQA
jgi:Fe-S cluster biosynthesis and repair protein YggX